MKPFSRFPVSVATLAALAVLGSTPRSRADDDQDRRAAAESLLTAMHTEQMVSNNTTRITGLVDRFSQSAGKGATLNPEQTAAMKQAEDEARDTIRKELGYDTLKEEFVKAYAEAFTGAELKELAAFYNTPTAQKLTEKQTPIMDKVGQMAQQKMQTVLPGVMAKLREAAQKNLPPPPAPASALPVPAAPAVSALPGAVTTPVPPTTPVPATTPTAPTTVTTSPVPAIPTPLPTATGVATPSAQ